MLSQTSVQDARARQLPRREARALPHWARLVGVHALDLACSAAAYTTPSAVP